MAKNRQQDTQPRKRAYKPPETDYPRCCRRRVPRRPVPEPAAYGRGKSRERPLDGAFEGDEGVGFEHCWSIWFNLIGLDWIV